jgi:hypothetical protein
MLGWTGNTEISYSLLDGYIYPELHCELKRLAPCLAMPETIKPLTPIETRLTDEEFCSDSVNADNILLVVNQVSIFAISKQAAIM